MPTYTRHLDKASLALLMVGVVVGALCASTFGIGSLLFLPSAVCVVTGARHLIETRAHELVD